MGNKDFYKSSEYRRRQSVLTKSKWRTGRYEFLRKKVVKSCKRRGCKSEFSVQPSDPKVFCSQRCAALVSSPGRAHSTQTRIKIGNRLRGRKYDRPKTPPRFSLCKYCYREFEWRYWRSAHNPIKYCSRLCLIKDVGSRPTSPRAARAKAGIRSDLGSYYFYSRWEANYARLLNSQGIRWIFQPKTFRLKNQNYTPDFYLPTENMYVEIKNFLSDYSARRDREFRELYPNLVLKLILKKDYLMLQEEFASKIKTWEYS